MDLGNIREWNHPGLVQSYWYFQWRILSMSLSSSCMRRLRGLLLEALKCIIILLFALCKAIEIYRQKCNKLCKGKIIYFFRQIKDIWNNRPMIMQLNIHRQKSHPTDHACHLQRLWNMKQQKDKNSRRDLNKCINLYEQQFHCALLLFNSVCIFVHVWVSYFVISVSTLCYML